MTFDVLEWAGFCRFREQFESILDPRFYTIGWLEAEVLSGRYRLFASEKSAIIAEIRTYPTGAREVHGVVAAGGIEEIETVLIPQAEAWGKAAGCLGAAIESRSGWGRAMKKHGYRVHQVALKKDF